MPPSQFLNSTRSRLPGAGLEGVVPVPPLLGPPAAAAAAAPQGNILLGFRMQIQLQSEWCWAATGASTDRFYRPTSTLTQCGVANLELGTTSCCQTPTSCNQQRSLKSVLTKVQRLAPNGFTAGPVTFQSLQTQLAARRPVAVRVQWSGGGGHFVVIDGVEVTGNVPTVIVRDPYSGTSRVSYATFLTAYRGSGRWTHTYLTR